VELARAGGSTAEAELAEAESALAEFMGSYHLLNLDADRTLWLEARGLRSILEALLKAGKEGNMREAMRLGELARAGRQNLERGLRRQLGHEPLQDRRNLEEHDKVAGSIQR
jgi:hypothetical protein